MNVRNNHRFAKVRVCGGCKCYAAAKRPRARSRGKACRRVAGGSRCGAAAAFVLLLMAAFTAACYGYGGCWHGVKQAAVCQQLPWQTAAFTVFINKKATAKAGEAKMKFLATCINKSAAEKYSNVLFEKKERYDVRRNFEERFVHCSGFI
ncbi:hypothetical protein NPIL_507171 [Nephila pilipes]|uniref:Uncharacterized protein n=1 Tax=Nephila pilipes TaxID=299642 RepID=A0A8X6QNB6_NEPPI|nr:hypothetical protein NPIL_507171 [Nephila pilipes]